MTRLTDEALQSYLNQAAGGFCLIPKAETYMILEELKQLRAEVTLLLFDKWDAENGHKRTETDLEEFREKVEKRRAERREDAAE